MSIENQIAIQAGEPECDYCPVCEAPMTLKFYCGAHWLECDYPPCGHVIELKEES